MITAVNGIKIIATGFNGIVINELPCGTNRWTSYLVCALARMGAVRISSLEICIYRLRQTLLRVTSVLIIMTYPCHRY